MVLKTTLKWLLAICLGVSMMTGAQATADEWKVGKTYEGFKLLKEQKIPEISATGLLFEHVRSGAHLVKFVTDDPNKSFAITFKTPPEGDYGIPHILEHSVLNGSKNYPVKSPFDVLMKGSLNTFLNAMTMSDLTMYPVASTNAKDFFNLVGVYLDAVFYPKVHDDPRIFLQEGWRYELDSPEGELTYNGIVYNEMKGAYSSPESVLSYEVDRALFPDSPYGLSSGGHPKAIPGLKREQFLAFHKKHYHPSNAYITLWGDGDTKAELKFINGVLKAFKRKKTTSSTIGMQKAFAERKRVEAFYPIGESEKPAGKTNLALAWVAGSATDPVESMALDVLSDVLVNLPASPLRAALEDAGIGKDAYGYYDATKQGVFTLVVKNAEPQDADRFEKLVTDTLTKLAKDGLDKRMVEGVINKLEFRLREADYGQFPSGLVYTFFGVRGWLFAGDPFLGVAYEKPLAEVRKALKSDLLEGLIKKYLLDNPHSVLAVVKPKPGLEAEIEKARKAELAATKARMKPAEIKKIVEQTKALKAWQAEPDKPEDLAKIPLLTLADLDKKEQRLDVVERKLGDTKVLHLAQPTNGIIYLQLLFDTRVVPQELIPHVQVLADLLGDLDTQNFTYGDLDTELNINTGGINAFQQTFEDTKDGETYLPKFGLSGKALTPKFDKLVKLAAEMALRTRYGDRHRLKEVLFKQFARRQAMARNAGVYLAIQRLSSYLSPAGAYGELAGGLSYVQFLGELVRDYDKRADDLIADLEFVSRLIFNRNNLVVGVTCSEEDYKVFEQQLPALIAELDGTAHKAQAYAFDLSKKNEGLLAASKVQYVAQGADYRKLGFAHTGQLEVLNRILSRDFLTEKIRIQGGAYGAFSGFSRDGTAYFSSYRDPNLAKTLAVYDEVPAFVKGFEADERAMTRYIIGVIAARDKPMSPAQRGRVAISRKLANLDHATLQTERDQILSTKPADIQALAPLVKAVVDADIYCVYGNEKKIEENKKLFTGLVKVLQ